MHAPPTPGACDVQGARPPTRGAGSSDELPDGLPVARHLRARMEVAVRAHVESTLGWQVVDDDTFGVVPPALRLVDGSAANRRELLGDRIPTLLLVDADDDGAALARLAALLQPAAVLRWPEDLDALPGVAGDALARPDVAPLSGVLRVGGSAGGVGTTTIATCLAGLLAWQGARVLLATRGAGSSAPRVPTAALASSTIMGRAQAVPGVEGLRRVRLVDADEPVVPSDPLIDRHVVDVGVDPDADVLVVRPDRAGMEALAATPTGTVLVNGAGPVSLRALRGAAAGRRLVEVPNSARVARAGVLDRVPASVPGRWLRLLAPIVGLEPQRAARDG